MFINPTPEPRSSFLDWKLISIFKLLHLNYIYPLMNSFPTPFLFSAHNIISVPSQVFLTERLLLPFTSPFFVRSPNLQFFPVKFSWLNSYSTPVPSLPSKTYLFPSQVFLTRRISRHSKLSPIIKIFFFIPRSSFLDWTVATTLHQSFLCIKWLSHIPVKFSWPEAYPCHSKLFSHNQNFLFHTPVKFSWLNGCYYPSPILSLYKMAFTYPSQVFMTGSLSLPFKAFLP